MKDGGSNLRTCTSVLRMNTGCRPLGLECFEGICFAQIKCGACSGALKAIVDSGFRHISSGKAIGQLQACILWTEKWNGTGRLVLIMSLERKSISQDAYACQTLVCISRSNDVNGACVQWCLCTEMRLSIVFLIKIRSSPVTEFRVTTLGKLPEQSLLFWNLLCKPFTKARAGNGF